MRIGILCAGNASYDIYYPTEEFPEENKKYTSDVFLESCGGPASNAAFLLGLWGASCGFAGCVGNDSYGREVITSFRDAGVDTALLEVREDFHTPLSWIITNSRNGSRTILNRRRMQSDMDLPEKALHEISPPSHLLFDGHEFAASLLFLELFPAAVSVLDAGSLRPAALELAGKVTHLLCSESFASDATGITDLESNADLRSCAEGCMEINPRPGCFTLGSRGLVFWEDDAVFHLPAFTMPAVDSTAAGDIFHGAFVYSLCSGGTFREALLFGSAAAALSVCRSGGRTSIPAVRDVRTCIEEHVRAGTLPEPRLLR